MAGEVQRRMVEGAVQLLARGGLNATSFAEVLSLTGAPRGSIYHHFPGGKDQLVAAALDLASSYLLGVMESKAGAPAEELTEHFLRLWRGVLTRSDCQSGCAVVAVTTATDSTELMDHAAAVFRAWRGRLAEWLVQGGLDAREAPGFATTLIAATEGAVVLSRAERNAEPFDTVARQLMEQLRRLMAPSGQAAGERAQ